MHRGMQISAKFVETEVSNRILYCRWHVGQDFYRIEPFTCIPCHSDYIKTDVMWWKSIWRHLSRQVWLILADMDSRPDSGF